MYRKETIRCPECGSTEYFQPKDVNEDGFFSILECKECNSRWLSDWCKEKDNLKMSKTFYFNISGFMNAKTSDEVLGFLKMSLGFRADLNFEDIKVEEEK